MAVQRTTRHRRPIALLLVAGLSLATTALAEPAVKLELVTVKATGKPTGDPEIDPAIATLPAIKGICRGYARCEHAGTLRRELAWGEPLKTGKGAAAIRVSVDEADAEGRMLIEAVIGGREPCAPRSRQRLRDGQPFVTFCENLIPPDGTYLYVLTATRL